MNYLLDYLIKAFLSYIFNNISILTINLLRIEIIDLSLTKFLLSFIY